MEHDKDIQIARLLDYIDGNLPEQERHDIALQLQQDASLRQQLDELILLNGQLADTPLPDPSAGSQQRFMAFLAKEKAALAPPAAAKPESTEKTNYWLPAAVVLVLIFSAALGWLWQNNRKQQAEMAFLKQEIQSTQQMLVLSTLEKPSASDRIRAVQTLQHEAPDPKIIGALIHTMQFDEMPNVQVKAAKALANFAENEAVKMALIDALKQPDNPEVQIVIIDILVSIGEKRAVPAFQEILRDKALLDMVRNKAASGLEVLI